MNAVILIPSLNPSKELFAIVERLTEVGFADIIVVNDGSSTEYEDIFLKIKNIKGCHVLTHEVNRGKGRALKTGFEYFLQNFSNYNGVITVDADGQHTIDDIIKISNTFKETPDSLVLGVRDFDQEDVPLRSKLGNKVTRTVFKFLVGINIRDTQTGLRAIPSRFMMQLLNVDGEKFEFETNMLLKAKRENIDIEEVIINTVYIDKNSSSHFRPLQDSIKIYTLILKFTSVSLISFIIDISIFYVLTHLIFPQSYIYSLFLSTIIARVFSSLFNYLANNNYVFKSKEKKTTTFIKYYTLCSVQVIVSWLLLELANLIIKVDVTFLKILVDLFLYVISFYTQKRFIFKR